MPFSKEQYSVNNLPEHLKSVGERLDAGKIEDAFEVLTAPLHGELYARQDFHWTDTLPQLLKVALYFDYVWTQVLQGGFLQLISNHYVSLLLPLPEWFGANEQTEMAQVMDDALRVYVLNHEHLKEEVSVEEFAKRYEQFPEFAQFDSRFEAAYPEALAVIVKRMMEELEV